MRLLAGSFFALTTLSATGCTHDPPPPQRSDAGVTSDAGDAGASLLGFHASNLDNSSDALEAALADPTLGDLVLDDCGPTASSTEAGHVGCGSAPVQGDVYKQIDGFGTTQQNTQPPGDGSGSGSGGGGAGRIRINTQSGAAVISGLLSPSLTTSCATQGTLRP